MLLSPAHKKQTPQKHKTRFIYITRIILPYLIINKLVFLPATCKMRTVKNSNPHITAKPYPHKTINTPAYYVGYRSPSCFCVGDLQIAELC